MLKTSNTKLKVLDIIKEHIISNLKEYIIVSLIFIVGVFLGVLFINKSASPQKEEITTYINNYIEQAKVQSNTNKAEALKQSIKTSIILAVVLWFAGTTLIGIPAVFGIILFRGFCLGYTISACTYTMGIGKAIAFVLISVTMHNLLFIPAILAIAVSGIKLYKSIMRDKKRSNIKLEILRHTALSTIMLVLLILSSIIKINVSGGLVENLIKYF